jgi:hypothetical protein
VSDDLAQITGVSGVYFRTARRSRGGRLGALSLGNLIGIVKSETKAFARRG